MASFAFRKYKGLTILILVILGFAIILLGPSIIKSNKIKSLKGESEATLVKINEKKVTVQHYSGANEKLLGYNLTFDYTINRDNYTNTEFVKASADIKSLYEKFMSEGSCTIKISYDQEEPSISFFIGAN